MMGPQRLPDPESPPPQATVQIEGRADGPPIIRVTVQAGDVAEAARLAREQYDELTQRYATPSNGHRSPMQVPVQALPLPRVRAFPAIRVRAPRIDLAGSVSHLASSLDRDVLLIGLSAAILSLVAFWVLYWYGSQPVAWDARVYYDHALAITRVGLGGWADPLRTYAYPLFLAGFLTIMVDDPTPVHQAVGIVQCVLNVVMGVAVGWAVTRARGTRWSGLLTYCLIVLNPVLLIQATELLTDSLSATTIGLSIAPLIASWRDERRAARLIVPIVMSLFFASLSAAIRPANAIVIPAVAGLWIVRGVWFGSPSWRWLPLFAAVVALPLLPQVLSNYRAYKVPHPLIVSSLYGEQIDFGANMIKYGTTLAPGKPNQLRYENPFMPPGGKTASELFRASPLGYVATLGLHGFALLDQDQPFTYVYELHPWYRWSLSIAVYLFWFVAATGTASAAAQVVRLRAPAPATWAILTPAVLGAAYIAVYLPAAVEVRYGTPLFLLATPSVAVGLAYIARSIRERPRRVVGWAARAIVVVLTCSSLSAWITQQAPSLRG